MIFRTIANSRHMIGGYGKSLVFNGFSDYATIPEFVPSTSGFTVAGWFNIDPTSPAFGRLWDFIDGSTNGTRLLYDSNTLYRLNFDIADGTALGAVTLPGRYKVNKFIHVVCVYTGTQNKLYINGKLIQTQTKSMTAPTDQVFTLGRASNASGNFAKFSVSHLAVENSVWSEDEILDAFYGIGFPSGASWYDFDDSTVDQSGNGNDIVLDSGTSYSTEAPFSTARTQVTTRPMANELSSLHFNSTSGRAVCPTNVTAFHNQEFTMMAFINPENTSSQRTIFGWTVNGGPQFRLTNTNTLGLVKQNVAGVVATTKTIPLNTWSFVALTFASNGDYGFYYSKAKNKPQLLLSGNSPQTFTYSDADSLILGNIVGFAQAFRGKMKNIKLFNTPLDISNIQKACKENNYNTISGCVGLWQFNEGSGSVANDDIFGNNATITSAVYSDEVMYPSRTAV